MIPDYTLFVKYVYKAEKPTGSVGLSYPTCASEWPNYTHR